MLPIRADKGRPTGEGQLHLAQFSQLADHELLRCIGHGSYGQVWLARNVIGSFRAVKVIGRATFRDDRPFEREFNGIRRFEPISRTHPGFISILHIGRDERDQYFYYIMEAADDVQSGQQINPEVYVPKTLDSELGQGRRLPLDNCLQIALSLTSALSHLHKNGLVHRDIKPSNVIFLGGQAKLGDIGLVTEIGESATFLGTQGYVAPEGPGKPAADIYSMGMLLYQASTSQSLQDFPEIPAGLAESADPRFKRLQDLVREACQMNPCRRLQSAEQLHNEILKLRPNDKGPASISAKPAVSLEVAIVYRRDVQPDADLAARLRQELVRHRHQPLDFENETIGVQWASEIERKMAQPDVVIVLLSEGSNQSELLAYQLEIAREAAQRQKGKPRLISVWLGQEPGGADPLAVPQFRWLGPESTEQLSRDLMGALPSAGEPAACPVPLKLETIGGAVPLDSNFYVRRSADAEFEAALTNGDSIVLVKGSRQVGKTSLLARALQQVRQAGGRVVFTDFQKINASSFENVEMFYRALGESLAEQLDLDVFPGDTWDTRRSPNNNFERYLRREILDKQPGRLVWGMDEVDRLFPCSLNGEVFALFRSWHNVRALEPTGPWSRLTLAIAYATEAHLFISDLAQSPFNVGTHLALSDFSTAQVHDLNGRYGAPLKSPEELDRFVRLVGGHPFLVRRGLHEFATDKATWETIEADDGIFGDHLGRILMVLVKDAGLTDMARKILHGESCSEPEAFYRLRSAGVMVGDQARAARPRCELYARYLKRHLL